MVHMRPVADQTSMARRNYGRAESSKTRHEQFSAPIRSGATSATSPETVGMTTNTTVRRTAPLLAALAVGGVGVPTTTSALAASNEPNSYSFRTMGPDNRPWRWDPCTAINYKVN